MLAIYSKTDFVFKYFSALFLVEIYLVAASRILTMPRKLRNCNKIVSIPVQSVHWLFLNNTSLFLNLNVLAFYSKPASGIEQRKSYRLVAVD